MTNLAIKKISRPETLRAHPDFPEMGYFTGTENYYRTMYPSFTYTDGVKYVAEQAAAYWLIDVVLSHAFEIMRNKAITEEQKRFLCGNLTLSDTDSSALFEMTDGNENVLSSQAIEFTDFPASKQAMWVTGGVLMLPSEY